MIGATDSWDGLARELGRRRSLGIRLDGHVCLACGNPLFGPEFLHHPGPNPSILDALRVAVVSLR